VFVRRLAVIAAAVLTTGASGCASTVGDPTGTAYRNMCVRSAHNAVDGLDMARRATIDPPGPFQDSLMERAHQRITSARKAVAQAVPPDPASAQRRARLQALLAQAERSYQALLNDGGPRSITAAQAVEDRLRDYITENS
jgi:hypothetical protein